MKYSSDFTRHGAWSLEPCGMLSAAGQMSFFGISRDSRKVLYHSHAPMRKFHEIFITFSMEAFGYVGH